MNLYFIYSLFNLFPSFYLYFGNLKCLKDQLIINYTGLIFSATFPYYKADIITPQ